MTTIEEVKKYIKDNLRIRVDVSVDKSNGIRVETALYFIDGDKPEEYFSEDISVDYIYLDN